MLIPLTACFSPQLIEVIGESFESGSCSPPIWGPRPCSCCDQVLGSLAAESTQQQQRGRVIPSAIRDDFLDTLKSATLSPALMACNQRSQ